MLQIQLIYSIRACLGYLQKFKKFKMRVIDISEAKNSGNEKEGIKVYFKKCKPKECSWLGVK